MGISLDNFKSIFTCRTLLGSLALTGTCLACDHILQLPGVASSTYGRAVVDNFSHGMVGAMSWAMVVLVIPPCSLRQLAEVILCGLLASLLDVDHFIAARSFELKEVLALPFRPPLHSTTLILLIAIFLLLGVRLASSSQYLQSLPYMFIVATFSHQLRDASRRGLWFWPLGSTPPLPYWIYIVSVVSLPISIRLVMERIDPWLLKYSAGHTGQFNV
ncbi:transmembrane protein 267-like [Asterias rubens]|uniref:transmembrane protein 267-like n=1 Tax=Asterias rubens TaxID=7604 RepID=UPI001455359C|nr:transmembrane protein 267-like [Asterias rubens]XP_033624606.1 transmembrane protein 267-like [Asterias rubens]